MLEVVKTKQDFVVAFGQESLLTPIASRQVDGGCLFVAVSICNKAGEEKPVSAPLSYLRVTSAHWSCFSSQVCLSGITKRLNGFGQNTLKACAFNGVDFPFCHKSERLPVRFYNSAFHPCAREVLGSLNLSCLKGFKTNEIKGSHMGTL